MENDLLQISPSTGEALYTPKIIQYNTNVKREKPVS